MANSEDASLEAMLKDAMIGTEKEIFGEAFGQDGASLDETGDRSLESMGSGLEGEHEPEDEEAEVEATEADAEAKPDDTETTPKVETKVEAEAKVEGQQDERGRVPPGRLREETAARRAVEAERDAYKSQLDSFRANFDKKQAESDARFEAILATVRAQQPQAKPAAPANPETPPDLNALMFENPQAYQEYVTREAMKPVEAMRKEMANMRLDMSMETARARHGETFDAAFTAIRKLDPNNDDNKALVQRFIAQPNPGEAMVAWHRRNETLREVGDDPAAYKARQREEARKELAADPEFRKQLLADLSKQLQADLDNGQPRTAIRLPPSLQFAAGSNGRSPDDRNGFDGSEDAIFASAFST